MEKEKQHQKEMEEEEEKFCCLASCPKPGSQRCTKCKTVWYCSKTCQERDWKEGHRTRCKEITWEHNKKEYDLKEAERQREAEKEQQQEDLEGKMLKKEEEEGEEIGNLLVQGLACHRLTGRGQAGVVRAGRLATEEHQDLGAEM